MWYKAIRHYHKRDVDLKRVAMLTCCAAKDQSETVKGALYSRGLFALLRVEALS